MRQISIAVCDEDPNYGEKLADWILLEQNDKYTGAFFTSMDSFSFSQGKKPFDIVLMGRGFTQMRFDPKLGDSSLWIALWDENDPPIPDISGIPVIKRYQSAPDMLREVFGYYQKELENHPQRLESSREVLGVYSPSRSIWQAPFSMVLSQTISGKEQVLYINLMECAGFGSWFGLEYQRDFLDFLYLLPRKKNQIGPMLNQFVYSMEGFDYIPPALDGQLLSEISAEDYRDCVRLLAQNSGYDVLVIDFGGMVPGFLTLLQECTSVYILGEAGILEEGEAQQFGELVKREQEGDLEEKITYLTLPSVQKQYQKEALFQQWLWGDLGDYVRRAVVGI